MFVSPRRAERAQALLEETLAAYPSGLSSIALMDRLERWGFPEEEGLAVIHQLQQQGRLHVERGFYLLSD